ncbi:HNH endonuclease [Mucilaginibacter lutimaris]|uniref:HNH endonuclease n=1 Tax=Mucilaginibacter lutimaris TaxID=931629 RepID=A0ABW2ZGB5_9SPHI
MNKYRYPLIVLSRRIANVGKENEIQESVGTKVNPEIPGHGTYGGLLFDPRWRARRAQILARDKDKCVVCSKGDELQVHHRQYHFIKKATCFKPPWDYEDHLLITLCKSCHHRGHSKFKVPIVNI